MSYARTHKYLIPAAAFLLVPTLAFAHPGHGAVSGLTHGLTHPLSGFDHLLAMVAVGILAFQLGRMALWVLPAVFLGLMAVGGGVGMLGYEFSFIEAGIALSVAVFGALIAFNVRIPTLVTAAAVGFFALFHGYAHGVELPAGSGGVVYAAGFLFSTAILHALGIGLGAVLARISHRFGPTLTRTAGGLASVAGIGFLFGALAG